MTCIACGGGETRTLYEVRGFPIVRCTACGLARTVLPEGFDPDAIYTEDYFQGGHHDGYADYAGSGEVLRHEFRRTLDALPARGGNLVELGCAYGFFLDEARARFDVCGVEVAEAARAACVARGHVVARDSSKACATARPSTPRSCSTSSSTSSAPTRSSPSSPAR